MKNEDAEKLKPRQKVIHRRYSVCIVKEVVMARGELFGVVVRPDNQNGRDLLQRDCEFDVPDVLEDRARNLSIKPVETGYKPIEHEMAWGIPEEDLPKQEPKNHFAPIDEVEITGYQPDEDSRSVNKNLPTNEDTIE
ncbi:hypothetical protein ES703_84356 [subsurface metagenome]